MRENGDLRCGASSLFRKSRVKLSTQFAAFSTLPQPPHRSYSLEPEIQSEPEGGYLALFRGAGWNFPLVYCAEDRGVRRCFSLASRKQIYQAWLGPAQLRKTGRHPSAG